MTLTGFAAIEYAESHGLLLSKYNDPIEEAREGLSPEEARAVAREDPKLIYLPLALEGWTAGDGTGAEGYRLEDYFAEDGSYRGPDEHGIEPVLQTESKGHTDMNQPKDITGAEAVAILRERARKIAGWLLEPKKMTTRGWKPKRQIDQIRLNLQLEAVCTCIELLTENGNFAAEKTHAVEAATGLRVKSPIEVIK